MVETIRAQVGLANPGALAGEQIVRVDSMGALITNPLGKYYQIAKNGVLFHITTTTLAGLAPGTDAADQSVTLVVHNPSSSGKDLVIFEGRVGRGSTGDLGPGTIYWVMEDDSTLAVPTGTDATVVNGYVGGGNAKVFKALHTGSIQGTNPRPIRIAAAIFENVIAGAAAGVQSPAIDDVGGSIIVPPGVWVGLSGHSNAGASPLVTESILLAQVPV
jgi:hypothetical protein